MSSTESNAANSLFRQFKILSLIQTGRWTGTRQIQEGLHIEGIEVSLRTIQRDLVDLSNRFLIEGNGQVPQGWRWKKDANVQSFPQMNSLQAVSFVMVEEHLKQLLPSSMLIQLRPWFEQARQAINQQENTVKNWLDRVRIISPTQPLIAPTINVEAQQAIYEALLLNRKITSLYAKRGASESKVYHLNPLGIVQRGSIIYLICTKVGQMDILTFALHRFQEAHYTEEIAHRPPNFDLDEYIRTGGLGFTLSPEIEAKLELKPNNKTKKLILMCTKKMITGLIETPLGIDQRIIQKTENQFELTVTVPITAQLVWWLRGYGMEVTILQPPHLDDIVKHNEVAF